MKISSEKAARIKADITSKMTQVAIAKKHKVSRSLVSDIATGRAHKDVPWPNGEPVPKRAGGQRKKIAEHDPTNKRILELEAEVIHLTEERNRERVKSKASAKTRRSIPGHHRRDGSTNQAYQGTSLAVRVPPQG